MIKVALVVILAALPPASAAHPIYPAAVQKKDQDAKKTKTNKGLSDDEVLFIESARKGDNEAVKRFLDAGMSANLVDKRDEELSTILMVAAMAGQTETTKLLIAKGADVKAKTKKERTALTWASWRGMTDTVKALLASGAEIDARDQRGGSPLMFAVSRGRLETVKVLLDAGANPNLHHFETGQTALIDAVVRHYVDVVRVLLAKGARVDDQDKGGRKAVDWARRLNFVDIQAVLMRATAR